jgi:hypothetical protein
MFAGLVFLGLALGLLVAAITLFRRASQGSSTRGHHASRTSSDRHPLSSHDVYSPLFFSSTATDLASSHHASSTHDGSPSSAHDCSCDSSCGCDTGGSCDSGGGGGSCGCD